MNETINHDSRAARHASVTTRRHPTPLVATERNSPASSGVFADAPVERETAGEASSLQSSDITARERTREALRVFRSYWVAPSLLAESPVSVAELAAYARHGRWTAQPYGLVRALGIWWYRLVGLPVTVVCRYIEWICQRPGRALPIYLLWKLLIGTGPGPWLHDRVIQPVLGVVAWVLF